MNINKIYCNAPLNFLSGVCRHEPEPFGRSRQSNFLSGVCRHEPALLFVASISGFLSGVCRHEQQQYLTLRKS